MNGYQPKKADADYKTPNPPTTGSKVERPVYKIQIQNRKEDKTMSIRDKYIGERVIVRCDRSGVFYGTLAEREGQECVLRDVRCTWYWDGAATLLQMAADGVKKPKNCKFTMRVAELVVLDAVEILPCTDTAIRSIEDVEIWKA